MWEIAPFVDGHLYLFLDGIEVFAKEGFAFFLPFFRIAPSVHKYLRKGLSWSSPLRRVSRKPLFSTGCPEKIVTLSIRFGFLFVANAKLQIFGDLPKGLSSFLSA